MKIKREVRFIYLAVFRAGKQVDIRDLIKFYEDYDEFRKKILLNDAAPSTIKTQLTPIQKPKYLEWVGQYLIGENK